MKIKNKKIILGASDAMVGSYCSKLGVDYVWASSFIISSMLGKKDEGIINIACFLPIIKAIIAGSLVPVILDFDIGGRNITELRNNLNLIKKINLGGICMEDEGWPKFNAMIKTESRRLISPDKMVEKLAIVKSCLRKKSLMIARTHSFIVNESVDLLQERINKYANAGADIICIYNPSYSWRKFQSTLKKIDIKKPLLIIVSQKRNLPRTLYNNENVEYILYPNQLYRMMLYPISKIKGINLPLEINTSTIKIDSIFNLVDKINEKK